jgi:outer membrane protein OmpA-like peptidoglycan-associated protein
MKQRKMAVLFVALGLIGALFLDGCASGSRVVTTDVVGGSQGQANVDKGKTLPISEANMERILAREFAQNQTHMSNHADTLAKHILQMDKNTTALAEELVEQINRAHEKTTRRLDEVQVVQKNNFHAAQQTLEKIEEISKTQGSGQITLFFKGGSAVLDRFQYQRLVNFLDFLSRESRGREVLLVSIGSASATGRDHVNRKLSTKRSEAPLPLIKKYLVNIPHKLFDVVGISSQSAPKKAEPAVNRSHQSVRIIAVYETSHIPGNPKG